jgi:hypothetical protein
MMKTVARPFFTNQTIHPRNVTQVISPILKKKSAKPEKLVKPSPKKTKKVSNK